MEANGLVARREEADGEKVTTIYKSPPKRIQFSCEIIEPYEKGCFQEQQKRR
jgi:hypothetical protein